MLSLEVLLVNVKLVFIRINYLLLDITFFFKSWTSYMLKVIEQDFIA